MPQEKTGPMSELSGNSAIKLKPSANDALALRDLCGTLNNPLITGAVVPPEEKAAMEKLLQSPTPLVPNTRESTSIAPAAAPVSTPESPTPALTVKHPLNKVFLTGRAGGAEEVARQTGAFVLNLRTLIETQMRSTFGTVPTPALVKEFQAWSSGVVSAQYPQTLTRTLLESLIRKSFPTFGQPDYWINLVVEQAEKTGGRVVVTGIDSIANFKALQQAGFAHYHVMLSNVTAQNKTLSPDPLSDALDNDVIKKISFQKQGARLHVVWNDNQPSPSGRFYSLAEFLGEFSGPIVREGDVEIQ